MHKVKKLAPLCCALGSLMFATTDAHASGFALPNVGPTNVGVTTTGPLSLHYNVAGLGYAKKLRINLGGDLLIGDLRIQRVREARYQRSDSLDFVLPVDEDNIDPDKSGREKEVSATPVGIVPSIHAEIPLPDLPLVVGVGIDVPYAAIVRLPGAGPQRFQLDDAMLMTAFMNVAVAYRPIERLSLGFGVSYVLGYASLSRTQDLAAVKDLGDALARPPINQTNGFGPDADPALRELDTFARPFRFNNGWASGITFRAGIQGQLTDDLTLGVSYEHRTKLHFRGNFSLDMNDPFFTGDLASQGLKYPTLVRGKSSLSMVLPPVVRAGLRYQFGGRRLGDQRATSIALEGTFTGWSSVDYFDVRIKSSGLAQPQLGLGNSLRIKLPRRWRDTYGGMVRGSHAFTEVLTMWSGVGLESAAVPNRTIDASSPDSTRLTVTGGLTRALTDQLKLILDFNVQAALKRTVRNSDYDLGNGSYALRLYTGGAYLEYTL